VEFIKPLYVPLVVRPAQWMLEYRDHNGLPLPSWDLWEERRGIHTFTVASTIGALHAAAAFARDFGELDRAAAVPRGAERMKGSLRRHAWHPEQKRFARMLPPLEDGTYRLDMTADSANYALFAFAVLSRRPIPWSSATCRGCDRVQVKTDIGGYARYERDYYHQVERQRVDDVPGNPWVICTLWHAMHVDRQGANDRGAQAGAALSHVVQRPLKALGRARRAVQSLHRRHHRREPAHVEPRDVCDRRHRIRTQAPVAQIAGAGKDSKCDNTVKTTTGIQTAMSRFG
jgi:GH15 family glucan-1,4-alpha-glucosidase